MPSKHEKDRKRKCKKREERERNRDKIKKKSWSGRKSKSVDNVPVDYFYTIPNSKLITILIVVSIIIALFFFFFFKHIFQKTPEEQESVNNIVGSYLSLIALPVGVVLSFIVASAWATFSDAQSQENQEATQLLELYSAVKKIDGGDEVAAEIMEYTAFIIDTEFDLMQKGIQSQEGTTMLFNLGDSIYNLEPEGTTQEAIYSQVIDMYRNIVSLRIARMGYTTDGLAPELWWVLILGVVIVIICSFFMVSPSIPLQIFMTILAVTALVSMLFLILALDKPYQGDFGLDSLPFEIALFQMEMRI